MNANKTTIATNPALMGDQKLTMELVATLASQHHIDFFQDSGQLMTAFDFTSEDDANACKSALKDEWQVHISDSGEVPDEPWYVVTAAIEREDWETMTAHQLSALLHQPLQ